MDIAKKDSSANFHVPTTFGMWASALKIALLPGLALMCLIAAPLAGYQIPGEIQGISVHTIATLGFAALLFALVPMIWRSGYRRADYGDDRLAKVIKNHADLGAKELLQRILADLTRHRGDAEQSDDITVVAVKRTNE